MIGIQLTVDKAVEAKNKCFEEGYLIGSVGSNTLRLLPPLIITAEDIDGMVDILDKVLNGIKN
jgi:acetylornithine aminotransferase/acetylornithine/N-succinyldiaminopimelate aminotransferase